MTAGLSARRACLALSAAALVLTACGSAPQAAATRHPAQSPAVPAATTPPAPAPAATPLIAHTAVDVAACHQFAAEQAGEMSADQFDVWLLQHGGQAAIGPQSATGLDNTLSVTLGDWYAVQASAPSGDLQPASYYAAEVGADCRSIGA